MFPFFLAVPLCVIGSSNLSESICVVYLPSGSSCDEVSIAIFANFKKCSVLLWCVSVLLFVSVWFACLFSYALHVCYLLLPSPLVSRASNFIWIVFMAGW